MLCSFQVQIGKSPLVVPTLWAVVQGKAQGKEEQVSRRQLSNALWEMVLKMTTCLWLLLFPHAFLADLNEHNVDLFWLLNYNLQLLWKTFGPSLSCCCHKPRLQFVLVPSSLPRKSIACNCRLPPTSPFEAPPSHLFLLCSTGHICFSVLPTSYIFTAAFFDSMGFLSVFFPMVPFFFAWLTHKSSALGAGIRGIKRLSHQHEYLSLLSRTTWRCWTHL